MRGGLVPLLCAAIAIAVVGCSFAARPAGIPSLDLTGVWVGNLTPECSHSRTSRCFVHENVSFTLVQQEALVSGFYQCWTGDRSCTDLGESGRVVFVGMQQQVLVIRVMMKNRSSCIFEGVPRHEGLRGGYICLETRGAIGKGWWEVRRAY